MNKNLINTRNLAMYIMGMVLCPLGVTFSAKAGYGVSMIEAPVYVSYNFLSTKFYFITFGKMEYILQAIVIALLCVMIKKFNPKYLLSFLTAFLFGVILDSWRGIFGNEMYEEPLIRIIACGAGILITSFAVACFLRTDLPQEAWELFVKEYSEQKKVKLTKVKWIYDISSLLVGIILMFVFFHKFDWKQIGVGTLVTTAVNAPLIGALGKLIDKIWKPQEPETDSDEGKEKIKIKVVDDGSDYFDVENV